MNVSSQFQCKPKHKLHAKLSKKWLGILLCFMWPSYQSASWSSILEPLRISKRWKVFSFNCFMIKNLKGNSFWTQLRSLDFLLWKRMWIEMQNQKVEKKKLSTKSPKLQKKPKKFEVLKIFKIYLKSLKAFCVHNKNFVDCPYYACAYKL
jgi:hypothetical protein